MAGRTWEIRPQILGSCASNPIRKAVGIASAAPTEARIRIGFRSRQPKDHRILDLPTAWFITLSTTWLCCSGEPMAHRPTRAKPGSTLLEPTHGQTRNPQARILLVF